MDHVQEAPAMANPQRAFGERIARWLLAHVDDGTIKLGELMVRINTGSLHEIGRLMSWTTRQSNVVDVPDEIFAAIDQFEPQRSAASGELARVYTGIAQTFWRESELATGPKE